ncbi:MAG TPA: NUDIX hydrolase [Candidatus Saccharimonadia bacterium]|nr:NUDIX hydrolase [Candidatus Saccharimonadia bacterium]
MITCEFEDGNQASLRHAVVDTLVLKDDKILMVKRTAKLLEGGKWGIVGGFVDRDETVAEAAAREVFEETGWKIKDLTLLTYIDNPNRPNEDRQNISFVFFCEAVEQTGQPDWESDEVRWYPLNELPARAKTAFDHIDSIDLYKKYLAENLALPILH